MDHSSTAVDVLKRITENKGGKIRTFVVCTSNGGTPEWYQPNFGSVWISIQIDNDKIVDSRLVIGETVLDGIVFDSGLNGESLKATYEKEGKKFVFYFDIPMSFGDDPARAALVAMHGKNSLETWVGQQ